MKRSLLLVVILFAVVTREQTKPEPRRLNPEASKVWLDIETAKAELRRQYAILESQQAAIAIGAGIPQGEREHWINDKGVIVFVAPKPEEAKTSPEKK